MKEVTDTAEGARVEEFERALRLIRRGEDAARVCDDMSRRLMTKLLHVPTKNLLDST